MAANKESMVIILDVGIGAEKLTKDAAKCSLKVIKNKIFNDKIDMLSFLLLRAAKTDNVGNAEESDQYLNICQVLPGSQIPTWEMARELTTCLESEKSKTGDWIDALVVAIGIITEDAALHKTRLSKIVLFHNFDSPLSSLDDAIVEKLNELNCKLIIVSHNIHYIPDSEGNLQAQFKCSANKNPNQAKNEELAMELQKLCPLTQFCNFNDAIPIILCKKLVRPWTWNGTLAIGSKIVISVSGVIAVKEDTNVPKFQKKSKILGENIVRQKVHYSGVDELKNDLEDDQKIAGYMLGNTPMPYDPSLGQAPHIDTKRGIYFVGFVGFESVPQEHFTGSSTYVLFPQKGKRISAKILDSLVRVMLTTGTSMLAWKVYNNSNKPKLVVLIPTIEYELAGLSMIELSYHSQHRFWDFPKLHTKKNQPTTRQLEAIDQLMASMDLSTKHDTIEESYSSLSKDRLPFDFLPNIRQQYLIDFLSSKILKQPSDKSSLEFVKVPDFFQPEASEAVENVKKLFDLKKSEALTKDKLKKHFFNGVSDGTNGDGGLSDNATTSTAGAAPLEAEEEIKCTHVSTVTPAEDFKALIKHVLTKLPNGPERAAKFHQYTCQMCSVISDLLFKSMTKQYEKIRNALMVYREISKAAESSYDYNDWMRSVRAKVIERKMFDFWEDVIVKNKLGLCSEEDPQVEKDFYDISKEIAASSNVDTAMDDDESVEDLFGNM